MTNTNMGQFKMKKIGPRTDPGGTPHKVFIAQQL